MIRKSGKGGKGWGELEDECGNTITTDKI